MWIEIWINMISLILKKASRLARALWIEIWINMISLILKKASRLARALWIEIFCILCDITARTVEARESLVD